MKFPEVSSSNLEKKTYNLPADFEGEINLVIIAFQRWHQSLVDTWLPAARQLAQDCDRFRYYEIPTIQRLNFLMRGFINSGMRAGIPDRAARAATITLYLDKEPFREALEIPNEDTIYPMLVDRQGQVLWSTEGEWTEEKSEELEQSVKRFCKEE